MIGKILRTCMLQIHVPDENREWKQINTLQFQNTDKLRLVLQRIKDIIVGTFADIKLPNIRSANNE